MDDRIRNWPGQQPGADRLGTTVEGSDVLVAEGIESRDELVNRLREDLSDKLRTCCVG
jgi:hypothetical protein